LTEAFVYLWYDAPNKMYYLGKHKGSPDDTYTHSSSIWESFTKDNIPEGVTREILAYGTDEEMCILEHKLLVEAKNGSDWNRYYNESLGDPRYVDQWGENNPMYGRGAERTGENNPNWKGGISLDIRSPLMIKQKKEYDKKHQTPERKALKVETSRRWRARLKAETGYTRGFSRAKNKTEAQSKGTLEPHMN